jgi:hypothetical protein
MPRRSLNDCKRCNVSSDPAIASTPRSVSTFTSAAWSNYHNLHPTWDGSVGSTAKRCLASLCQGSNCHSGNCSPAERGWALLLGPHSSECFGFIKDWAEKKVRCHMARARQSRSPLGSFECSHFFRMPFGPSSERNLGQSRSPILGPERRSAHALGSPRQT